MQNNRDVTQEDKGKTAPWESEEGSLLITRRRFFGYASGVLSALIAAALGLPLARFYVGTAFKPRKPRWLKLGQQNIIPKGKPQLFRVSYVDRDGWRETTQREDVYVVTGNGDDYLVLSNVCTHLGCPVHWDEQAHQFLCPCHAGAFGLDGRVVKGPPPKPLVRLEHKVENGMLFVRIEGT